MKLGVLFENIPLVGQSANGPSTEPTMGSTSGPTMGPIAGDSKNRKNRKMRTPKKKKRN